ncbi:MAG: flavodoxin family protein [archaeon]|nr:flavodoxin family protein [archaeon]
MSKFVVFMGSPRKKGNSYNIANQLIESLKAEGAEIVVYELNQPGIKGCIGCGACRGRSDCIQKDPLSTMYQDVRDSDGVVFVSPIYMNGITGQAKICLDRMYPFLGMNLQPRLPDKKALCVITMGERDEEKFYQAIGQVMECFKVFGWEQFEPIICSGTDEFGYKLPDIQDKIKAAVSDLLGH